MSIKLYRAVDMFPAQNAVIGMFNDGAPLSEMQVDLSTGEYARLDYKLHLINLSASNAYSIQISTTPNVQNPKTTYVLSPSQTIILPASGFFNPGVHYGCLKFWVNWSGNVYNDKRRLTLTTSEGDPDTA